MPDCTLTIKWLKQHIAEHHSKIIGSLFSADEERLQDDLQIQAVDDGCCFAMEEIPEVFVSERVTLWTVLHRFTAQGILVKHHDQKV